MPNIRIKALFTTLIFVFPAQVFALSTYVPNIAALQNLTNAGANALIQTVAVGADYHAYMPASPMGLIIGLDVGLDVTFLTLPSAFNTAFTTATGAAAPGLIPIPKLNIHKGLPKGIDLGFTFSTYSDPANPTANLVTIYGGEVKWAFIDGGIILPSVAVRGAASMTNVFFMNTNTYTLDLTASKTFFLFEPYIGAGMDFWSGTLSVSGGSLPTSVSASQSGANPHFYVGTPIKILFLRVTAEYDYSLAGVTTYGGKISINF